MNDDEQSKEMKVKVNLDNHPHSSLFVSGFVRLEEYQTISRLLVTAVTAEV